MSLKLGKIVVHVCVVRSRSCCCKMVERCSDGGGRLGGHEVDTVLEGVILGSTVNGDGD